ncbi:xanthine dehydrogenase family protein molybdopterin-binding subunit [Nonomuraea sp. NPDC050790]|uniref:xanthine dehydrogenase family protein molybdopterin-binding subunit n=1 Tax=Nonomuraea sp. NPDC050790 TaxID=3364371 RepID=UPI00379E2020
MSIDRIDGPAKTTGAARYAAEFPYPDLAYAVMVHATISRGRITSIDTSEVKDVVAVITHENAPRMKPPPRPNPVVNIATLMTGSSVNYLNTDEVHWDGQPVAVVVADTLAAAQEGAARVRVGYAVQEGVVDFAAEEPNAVPQKNDIVSQGEAKKGDAEAALAAAAVTVDLRFTTPPQNHNALEPHSTTAIWDGERLTLHDSTQSLAAVRYLIAHKFGLKQSQVRVIAPQVGGGFGGKAGTWPGTIMAALAARVTGRPIRMMLSRKAVYRTVGGRTPSTQRVALGADADGAMTALIHTSVARVGRTGGHAEQITSQTHHLYDARNLLARQNLVKLDLVPNTSMRAPGEAIGTFALESAVDELAVKLGMDPIELRLRNEPERDPIEGKAFSHRMLRECYERGAKLFGWEPGERPRREGRWLVGRGVATAYHPAWQFHANVVVRLKADGSVLVRCGFQEMGMGSATAVTQIVSEALGVPPEKITVEYGDSDLPTGPAAGGSAQTASVAAALVEACAKLARRRHRAPVEVRVGADSGLGAIAGQVRFMGKLLRDRRRWQKAACGAHFCEVRVDADTGETRVSRWTSVFDVGRVINAKMVASQLRGGIVMGIGAALSEETLVDPRSGRVMNASLSEYHVPVHADVPVIDVHWIGDPDPTMPLGVVGVGEVGITGVAGAVGNAVRHATGIRVTDLPITLDKLL